MATEESFLNNVENHEMTIIRDEGVNRHIRFAIPGSSEMQFDLITWPGYLCYTGDMGTYVFDMFEFFLHDVKSQKLSINPPYWAGKVEGQDKHDGVKEFNEDIFVEKVMRDLKQWIKNNREETTKEERRELWEAVIDEVVDAASDSGGYRKQSAAMDFRHSVNDDLDFSFQDFWEYDLTDYTYRYLWCCYALVWGIGQYNQSKVNSQQEVA